MKLENIENVYLNGKLKQSQLHSLYVGRVCRGRNLLPSSLPPASAVAGASWFMGMVLGAGRGASWAPSERGSVSLCGSSATVTAGSLLRMVMALRLADGKT